MHSILSPAYQPRMYTYYDPGKLYPTSSQHTKKHIMYNARYILWKPIVSEYLQSLYL